jgi:hypothetical protein
MSTRNTEIRTLHDVGAAAWCGGSLMSAIGLNGASQIVTDPTDRTTVASTGWARWAPFSAAAISAHVTGGLGLLLANRDGVQAQAGVGATAVKTALTAAALGTTAYSGVFGSTIAKAGKVPAESGVLPATGTPTEVASAQQRLRVLQWATPALVAVIIALGAQQGEQQRPQQITRGGTRKFAWAR